MTPRQELLAEIQENQHIYITFLQQLIRAASPNPPGQTTEAAQVIQDYLSERGIESKTIAPVSHAPNVVAEFFGEAGPGHRIIFNGHIDTYPVENPDAWKHGPYSGHSDGNKVHGRGAVDMKAGTAASVVAYALLHKRAQHLKGSSALTIVSDEETGGKFGTRYLLENCGTPSPWTGDVVLNGEPGGLQSVRFGEKGTLRLTFTVQSSGANGAYTFKNRGAIITATFLISRLLELEHIQLDLPEKLRKHLQSKQAREAADSIMGKAAADALLTLSVNIGTIHGGVKVNTVPENCVFEADIRLPIGLDKGAVLERIEVIMKEFPNAHYKVQEAASNGANFCAFDHPFAQHVKNCAKEATGTDPVMIVGLGGTDCKFYRYRGIPAYVYGPSPEGMGDSEEAVSIHDFVAVVQTHTLAVWDYLTL